MSMLHSFYCWGHVAVVLLSTVFFALFGVENWRIMAVLWALVPIYNLFVFCKVPMCFLQSTYVHAYGRRRKRPFLC